MILVHSITDDINFDHLDKVRYTGNLCCNFHSKMCLSGFTSIFFPHKSFKLRWLIPASQSKLTEIGFSCPTLQTTGPNIRNIIFFISGQ